jgi:hypothetical protein
VGGFSARTPTLHGRINPTWSKIFDLCVPYYLLQEVAYAKCGVRGMLPVTTTVTLEVKHEPSHGYGTSLGGVTVAIDKLLDMQRQTHGRYQWYLISFED